MISAFLSLSVLMGTVFLTVNVAKLNRIIGKEPAFIMEGTVKNVQIWEEESQRKQREVYKYLVSDGETQIWGVAAFPESHFVPKVGDNAIVFSYMKDSSNPIHHTLVNKY